MRATDIRSPFVRSTAVRQRGYVRHLEKFVAQSWPPEATTSVPTSTPCPQFPSLSA